MKKVFFSFSFFFSFNVSVPASVAPPYEKDPPSARPPFSFFFLSVPLFLCFVLRLSLSLSFSPLLPFPCMLWYADMQEFLGLKMIDQTCQPWLLLLKMAALAVCVPVIGAYLSYSSFDWSVCTVPRVVGKSAKSCMKRFPSVICDWRHAGAVIQYVTPLFKKSIMLLIRFTGRIGFIILTVFH